MKVSNLIPLSPPLSSSSPRTLNLKMNLDSQPPTSNPDTYDSDEEFEFSPAVRDLLDQPFQDGHAYPLFDRGLLDTAIQGLTINELRSESVSSSSSMDDVDAVAAGQYCEWTPRSVPSSPGRCKKSSSTGSEARRWRLRDLVVGRSHSDGKDKFEFLAPPTEKKSPPKASKEKGKGGKVTEVNMATLHRLYYDKPAGGGGGERRSSLPYKQDFIGFLGLGRTRHFH